jgi:hypothetical protein
VKLTWYNGKERPPQFKEGLEPRWDAGVIFGGKKGMLLANYDEHHLLPKESFADFKPPEFTPIRSANISNDRSARAA